MCFGQGAVPKSKLAASHPRLDFSMVTRELFREEKSSFLQLCSVLQCWEGLAIAAFSKLMAHRPQVKLQQARIRCAQPFCWGIAGKFGH